jgi:thiol-disulfide isomerase/thioredoxin
MRVVRGSAFTVVLVLAVLILQVGALSTWAGEGGDETFIQSTHLGLAFPEFSLVDVGGRRWTKADLVGKTVLVNVWATWCKPCNEELPEVQRLHELLGGRDDVLLVTMNVDEKPEKAAPFLRKKRYTFPVVPAYTLLRKDMGLKGIPRNWVLDRSGVIRVDVFGVKTENGSWVEWATAQLNAVARESH